MSEYDFTEIACHVAERENIQNYKLEHQYSSNKGDGYTGSVRAVNIIGSNKQLNVVFKYSHRDPKAHEHYPLHQMYTTEIEFYEVIAPAFKKFQADHQIKEPFNNVVEYYGAIKQPLQECIALENIKCKRFEMWDRKKEMNQTHLEMTLQTLAKFHATSMAMKQLNPTLYKELTTKPEKNNISVLWEDVDIYKQMQTTIKTFSTIFDPNTEKIYKDKLDYYRDNIAEIMRPVLQYHDKYDVILQGDCWCNNGMYLYNDSNDRSTPIDIMILDWQLLNLGPVTQDLTYFFYSIVPKEDMANMGHYLKVYHRAVEDHLKNFELKVEAVYPYEVLVEHWKKYALYGLMMAIMIRKMSLVESEDVLEMGENSDDFMELIKISDEMMEIYKKQMRDIFMHMVDQKFL